MPFESDKQRRAMHAAAAGHSTIGIPQKVAQKFVADSGPRTIVDLAKRRKRRGPRERKR